MAQEAARVANWRSEARGLSGGHRRRGHDLRRPRSRLDSPVPADVWVFRQRPSGWRNRFSALVRTQLQGGECRRVHGASVANGDDGFQ